MNHHLGIGIEGAAIVIDIGREIVAHDGWFRFSQFYSKHPSNRSITVPIFFRSERSRSRERSERRRRSKSRESVRDKDRKSRDKKKSYKKEKDDSE